MFNYHYLNKISEQGTALWTEDFKPVDDVEAAEAAGIKGYLFKEGSLLEFVKKIIEG